MTVRGRGAMALDLLLVYPIRQHRRHAPGSPLPSQDRPVWYRPACRAWSSNAGRRRCLQSNCVLRGDVDTDSRGVSSGVLRCAVANLRHGCEASPCRVVSWGFPRRESPPPGSLLCVQVKMVRGRQTAHRWVGRRPGVGRQAAYPLPAPALWALPLLEEPPPVLPDVSPPPRGWGPATYTDVTSGPPPHPGAR